MLNQYVATPCGGDIGTTWTDAFQIPDVPLGNYVLNGMLFLDGAANGDAMVKLLVRHGRGRPQELFGTVHFAGYGPGAAGFSAAWPNAAPESASYGQNETEIGPVTVGTFGVGTRSPLRLDGKIQVVDNESAPYHLVVAIRQVTSQSGGLCVAEDSYLELRPLD